MFLENVSHEIRLETKQQQCFVDLCAMNAG